MTVSVAGFQMNMRVKSAVVRAAAGSLAAALALSVAATPSHAGGLFDMFFGGFHREAPPPAQAYADPDPAPATRGPALPNAAPAPRVHADNGAAVAFCVRTCDGHFFPVRANPGLSAAQACHSFCPASETKLYSGSSIDRAVTSDGSRYSDLPNAFAYRKQIVAGCTCNGHTPFGLARFDPKDDPTLKPGDVVMTARGPVAYNGAKNKTAEFTPVRDYSQFSKSYRDQLSALKLMPANPGAPAPVMASVAPAHPTNANRRAER